MASPEKGTAQARYDNLVTYREPFRLRAVDCATLTIPYLFPPLGFNASQTLPTPYQSIGARGVRTLAAKLMLSLFPPNVPFFKYSVDDFQMQKLSQQAGSDGLRGEVEQALSARERSIIDEMEDALFRPVAAQGLQHLINEGNFLLFAPKQGRVRGYRLDQYVCKRDAQGHVLELIVKECVSPLTLPEAVRAVAKQKDTDSDNDPVDIYTHVTRTETNWEVYQEVGGEKIAQTVGTYALDDCPWLVLRLISEPSEDYGRSYVEEFLGDLDSLEGLSETLVEGSAAAARVLFLVSPNGVTKASIIAKAKNGSTNIGNAADVTTVQSQKQADLKVALEMAQEINSRLSYAFMLNASVQRQAERVTAEEIRMMASDLDDALGGMYALLSTEFQLPTVRLFEKRMEQNRKVPPLPKGFAKPTITSGMQALGRGIDLRNLKAFVADIVQVMGPDVAKQYLQPSEFLKRASAAYGLDPNGLIKTDQQIAAEQQEQKLEAMAQALGPNFINAAGQIGKTAVQHQLTQQQQPNPQGPNGQANG